MGLISPHLLLNESLNQLISKDKLKIPQRRPNPRDRFYIIVGLPLEAKPVLYCIHCVGVRALKMKNLLLRWSELLRNLPLPFKCSFLQFPKTTIPCPPPTVVIQETLKRRIDQADASTPSITPLLRHWCDSGNQAKLQELRNIISSLQRSSRFSHALQITEWMSEQKPSYNLSSLDFEVRLLLIAKVRGLKQAYNFLDTIPLNKRDFYVYNALLNSCKNHNSVSLAEATFQKMCDLGFTTNNPKPYNTMLSLYNESCNHNMVVNLLREMDTKDIDPEGVSFAKLLLSYSLASAPDIRGMECFLKKWKCRVDNEKPWVSCFVTGINYSRAGSKEKGLALLRQTESLLDQDESAREAIYGSLMAMYCQYGERADITRLWILAKKHGVSFDKAEFGKCPGIMKKFTMNGLLDEILDEWDECPDLDLKDFGHHWRFVKEEADKVVDILGNKDKKGETLADKLANTMDYEDDKEEERMKKVIEAMERNMLMNGGRWNPKSNIALSAYTCLQYVEGRRDMESAADILRQLNRREQVLHAMDKGRLGLKLVEAMTGGGYVGGGKG